MGTLSKGITLKVGDKVLTNLQEIPELGGSKDSVEITTLGDDAHKYMDGINNYGDNIAFKFLYEKEQFTTLNGLNAECDWKVELPDQTAYSFKGVPSVKLDGVGVNAALTYSLNIAPTSAMTLA